MKPSRSLLFLGTLWILILLIPFSRREALSDWGQILLGSEPPVPRQSFDSDDSSSYGSTETEDTPKPKFVQFQGLKVEPKWKTILERYPNDRQVWLDAVLSTTYYGADELRAFSQKKYDEAQRWQEQNYLVVAKRFPDDLALEALALSNLLSPANNRHLGPKTSTVRDWSVSLKETWIPPDKKRWDAYRQRAIAGQKQEPNNVFWWWMELSCVLNARRDNEIWPILKTGSTKTEFNAHVKEVDLWRLEARQRTNGPLSSPEIAELRNHPLGGVSRFRQMSREVMEDVIGQRLLGQHKRALDGNMHLLQMARTVRKKSDYYIDVLVAQACEAIALNGPSLRLVLKPSAVPGTGILSPAVIAPLPPNNPFTPQPVPAVPSPVVPSAPATPPSPYSPPPRPRFGSSVAVYASDFGSLSYYAHQQGRRDIERFANQEWGDVGLWYKSTRKSSVLASDISLKAPIAQAAFLLNFGTVLLRGLPMLALLGLILWGIPRNKRLNRILGADETQVTPKIRWIVPFTFSLLSLFILFLACVMRIFCDANIFDPSITGPLLTQLAAQDWNYVTPGSRYLDDIPTWAWCFPAAVMSLVAFWIATGQQRKENGRLSLKERMKKVLAQPEHGLARFDLAPLMFLCGAMAYWTVIIGFLLIFFGNAMQHSGEFGTFGFFDVLCFVLFCGLCLAPRFSVWYKLRRRRLTLTRSNRYARQFFMTQAVVVSVLYLCICFFGWWAAVRTETVMRQNLQDGEMKAVRKSLGL